MVEALSVALVLIEALAASAVAPIAASLSIAASEFLIAASTSIVTLAAVWIIASASRTALAALTAALALMVAACAGETSSHGRSIQQAWFNRGEGEHFCLRPGRW